MEAALGQVGVGAGVESLDPVLLAVLVGDDDDRDRLELGVVLCDGRNRKPVLKILIRQSFFLDKSGTTSVGC